MINPNGNSFKATFEQRYRGEGSVGPCHTGYDEYSTFHDTLDIRGSLDYSDKQLKDMSLTMVTRKPILSNDQPYVQKIGEGFGGSQTFGCEDIGSSKFRGAKLVIEFLPGRSVKKMELNTETGELKLSRPGWFSGVWSMQTHINRQ